MFRFTFTIFPSLHPNFGVPWENMGLEPPPPLICKKTMTTDQQPIKTNIYFSHFSDNFFSHFSIPKSKFWRVMGRNGHEPTLFPFFSHTFFPFFHFSHPHIYIAGILGKNGVGPPHFIYIIPIPKSKFRHVLGKNGLEAQPAKYPFVTACVFGHSIRQWDMI